MKAVTDRIMPFSTLLPPKPKGMEPRVWEFMVDAYGLGGNRTAGDMTVAMLAAVRKGELDRADVPNERAMFRHLKSLTEFYSSSPVGLGDIPVDHAAYIFEVLAAVIEETRGAVHYLVRAEVDWIIRVRAATKGNDEPTPWQVYQFARAYWTAEKSGASTVGVDLTLAYFKPWLNSWDKLKEAWESGWIPKEVTYPGPYPGRAYLRKGDSNDAQA